MTLYIFRHGIAAERGTGGYNDDASRPLTPEGKRKVRLAARAMQALEVSLDRIVTSPYDRALQTAEIIAKAFRARNSIQLCEELTPSGSTQALIQMLNEITPSPESLMLVGHEPYLSSLISLLLAGNRGMAVALKKGGLCRLAVQRLSHGCCAELEWLLTPKQLGLMAVD